MCTQYNSIPTVHNINLYNFHALHNINLHSIKKVILQYITLICPQYNINHAVHNINLYLIKKVIQQYITLVCT